eukprot:12080342-Prorocentrum_lima.AAC.1
MRRASSAEPSLVALAAGSCELLRDAYISHLLGVGSAAVRAYLRGGRQGLLQDVLLRFWELSSADRDAGQLVHRCLVATGLSETLEELSECFPS